MTTTWFAAIGTDGTKLAGPRHEHYWRADIEAEDRDARRCPRAPVQYIRDVCVCGERRALDMATYTADDWSVR